MEAVFLNNIVFDCKVRPQVCFRVYPKIVIVVMMKLCGPAFFFRSRAALIGRGIARGGPPTISSFTPSIGVAGASVSLTGTNFDSSPFNDRTKFNYTYSFASAATTTTATTAVANGATSGHITMTTPLGSPWGVGWEWLSGKGPRTHHFTDGDPFTELLRNHKHIQQLINDVCSGKMPPQGKDDYSLGGLSGIPQYFDDYSTLLDGGLTGNLGATYLGSYNLNYSVSNGVLNINVYNPSTISSATHAPYFGYTPWWNGHIGKPLDNFFSTGPMSKTEQYFNFHVDLAGRGCGCKF